jgi:hypothetical protein
MNKDLPEATAGTDPKSLTLDHLAYPRVDKNTQINNINLCPIQLEDNGDGHFLEVENDDKDSNKKPKPTVCQCQVKSKQKSKYPENN